MSDTKMSETKEEPTAAEAPGEFEAKWEALGLGTVETAKEPTAPESEPESETVAKSDTLPVQGEEEALQEGSEETPTVSDDELKFIEAEFKRVGLEPDALKGKSERELEKLFANAISTVVRNKDRGFAEWKAKQAQGHSKDDGANGQTPGEAAHVEAPAAQESAKVDPAKLDEILTPFVEEFGEEAAPVANLLKAVVAQNAALEARLESEASARQRAPIEQAISEELAGNEVLSNPDKLDKFLTLAKVKAELDEIDLGSTPEEAVRRAIRHALGGQEPKPAPVQRVRTVDPASAKSEPTPSPEPDPFMETWRALGLPK